MMENVFQEVDGRELIVATDFAGSRVMERMLKVATEFQLRVLMDRLRGKYAQLMTHRFASHVVQQLLQVIVPVLVNEMRAGVKISSAND